MSTLQNQVDDKSKSFLRSVQYYGGEATTSEIRQRTGLSRTEVNYRFEKLEDLDLIEISQSPVGNGRRKPPKIAHLTGRARKEIERGLFGDLEDDGDAEEGSVEINEEEFNEMRREIDRLEQRLNVLTQSRQSGGTDDVDEELREKVESLDQRLTQVQAQSGGDGAVTPRAVAEAPAVKKLDERVATLETDLGVLEKYVNKWTENAETYLLALRRVVEEQLSIDFSSYLQAAENTTTPDSEDIGTPDTQ